MPSGIRFPTKFGWDSCWNGAGLWESEMKYWLYYDGGSGGEYHIVRVRTLRNGWNLVGIYNDLELVLKEIRERESL